jgi:hypothetical protein
MDRPPELSPVGWFLLGLWSIVVALYSQRWPIALGIFIGIALCHYVPWLAGLSPAALDAPAPK